MKLYELSQQYAQLVELVEELDEVTFRDTLESIQEEIDDKVENTAKLMRSFQVDVDALKLEEKRLADRRIAIEKRIESIKDYLKNQMEVAGIDKVKRPTLTVSIANNPPSVEIEDESLIPFDYMVPQPARIDKKALLTALKEGQDISGASIKQTRGVRIR